MTIQDSLLVKKNFLTKIILSDGNTFEQLFTQLMSQVYPDFKQVKPQGRIGDRSCDGFSETKELYCQVYAPEDLSKNDNNSVQKLDHDFMGLLNYWPQNGFKVSHFRYVINDKTKGIYPSTHALIQKLKLKYPNIDIAIWDNSDLESMFATLTDESKYAVIDMVPVASSSYCEHEALNDVVKHLMNITVCPSIELIPLKLDTQEKIKFNGLTDVVKHFLENALVHSGQVDDFFNNNNFEQRELLREKFSGLYKEAITEAINTDKTPDDIFVEIYQKACPENMKEYQNTAVRALMAYYFESCDIFKAPEI